MQVCDFHRDSARSRPRVVGLLSLALCLATSTSSWGDDWPQWGGPQRDQTWRESGLVDGLPAGTLPRVWSTPIGEGYAGPAVADGKVFVTDRIHDNGPDGRERVLCLNADTGEILWQHEYPCRYTISYPAGPRATPVYHDGLVYTIGAVGHMFCFDAETGDIRWSRNFPEDFATKLPIWGMSAAPLVHGDELITLVGGRGALVVSFDRRTGEERWRALNDPDVGYCPPMLFNFGGVDQLIVWHPAAISSLDPESGQLLWKHDWAIRSGLCIPSPRQAGTRLFFTAFYNGPLMLDVAADGSGASVVWRGTSDNEIETDGLHAIMCTPLVTDTHIYGVCSHGQLRCLDAQTGERLWETFAATGEGRWWNAFLFPHQPAGRTTNDDSQRVFIHNEQGELIIANLSPAGYEEVSRALLVEPTRDLGRRQRMIVWSPPAFAMQSVFARNDKEIVRVSLAAP